MKTPLLILPAISGVLLYISTVATKHIIVKSIAGNTIPGNILSKYLDIEPKRTPSKAA